MAHMADAAPTGFGDQLSLAHDRRHSPADPPAVRLDRGLVGARSQASSRGQPRHRQGDPRLQDGGEWRGAGSHRDHNAGANAERDDGPGLGRGTCGRPGYARFGNGISCLRRSANGTHKRAHRAGAAGRLSGPGRVVSRERYARAMSAADERAATVALLRNGRRPWVEYAELLEEYGSALAILEQDLSGQPL